MQKPLIKLIVKLLRETADKIEDGTCDLSEEEQSDILSLVTHKAISKEEACNFLNISRSKFDNLVRLGDLPRGRKRRGYKELVWYEDELRDYLHNQ